MFITSVFAGLVWTVCFVTVMTYWEVAVFSVIVLMGCSVIGIPLLLYLFFWRLPTYRRAKHAKEQDSGSTEMLEKLRDALVRELGDGQKRAAQVSAGAGDGNGALRRVAGVEVTQNPLSRAR